MQGQERLLSQDGKVVLPGIWRYRLKQIREGRDVDGVETTLTKDICGDMILSRALLWSQQSPASGFVNQ